MEKKEEDSSNNDKPYPSRDFQRHIAYLVTLGFFGCLVMLFIPITVTSTQRDLLSILIGMLASKWQTIMDFYFGNSKKKN